MTPGQRWTLITIGAALLAFGLGAGWQYMRAADAASRLEGIERELTFQRLENTLATATLEAQRDRYEAARQLSSSFFTELQAEIERAAADAQPRLQEVLAQRDAIITTLSRAEPDAAERLAQVFLRYRVALGEQVAPAEAAPPETTPAVPIPADTGDTIR